MTETMQALVYTATMETTVSRVPWPVAIDDQVLVEIHYCGICGSDMHAWHGQDERRIPPLILGHEASGIVRSGELAGKRVVLNPLMTCRNCTACLSGREHLCPQRELIGMRVAGAFAEMVAISAANLTILPDQLDFATAALAEPLACAIHAVRSGLAWLQRPASPQQDVAATEITVLGGGAIGLLAALVFRQYGISKLRLAETAASRRSVLAKCLDAELYDPLHREISPNSADLIFDAVGSGMTRAAASQIVRPGGGIVHIGLQDKAEGLDTRKLTLQDIGLIGSYCYTREDFAEAVRLLAEGHIKGDGWTDIRPLAEGGSGFGDIHDGVAAPKILLEMPVASH